MTYYGNAAVSVDEAKKMYCPFARARTVAGVNAPHVEPDGKCKSNLCMAWRWHVPLEIVRVYDNDPEADKISDQRYRSGSGVVKYHSQEWSYIGDGIDQKGRHKILERARHDVTDAGYCGMAGLLTG